MPKREPQLIDLLLPYQKRYVQDEARWKLALMARQVGKDFSSGFEGIRDCALAEAGKKKTTWLIAAPSERQSLESLEKWKEWATAFGLIQTDYREDKGGPQALLKAATITFAGGSRVIAVPGKPETVRGYSANVLMTEFAFFEDPDATWKAILPSITNPLRGGVKKVRLITTPNGIGNKTHDLWVKNFQPDAEAKTRALTEAEKKIKWSCHFVPITRAVEDGLPVDLDEIRGGLDDPDAWAQEYLCEFLDASAVLLPYELIATCESSEATDGMPFEYWLAQVANPRFMGIDFGRKRDLTCAWSGERIGDVAHTREVVCLQGMPTPDQIEILRPRIKQCNRVCLDYTGPGVGMGDYLVKEFGEWHPEQHKFGKIELCTFSNVLKVDIFSKLRMAFEKVRVRIPVNRTIREDLHSVSRVTTPGGSVSYKAPHTADGHADRATGLALFVRAAGTGFGPVQGSRVITDRQTVGNLGMGRQRHEVLL